jgi:hypothetical protein
MKNLLRLCLDLLRLWRYLYSPSSPFWSGDFIAQSNALRSGCSPASAFRGGKWLPVRFTRFIRFARFGIGLASVYEMRILGRKGAKNRFNRFGTVYGGAARKPNAVVGYLSAGGIRLLTSAATGAGSVSLGLPRFFGRASYK